MIAEFHARQWKRRTLFDLVSKIDSTGSCARKCGSGRRRSVRTFRTVSNMCERFDLQSRGATWYQQSPREIARATGISRSSDARIAKNDLKLKVFGRREVQSLSSAADKLKRLNASKRLKTRMTRSKISRTWFSDENISTVETPSNSQNDRVYVFQCRCKA